MTKFYQIKIDKNICVNCGNCEYYLKKYIKKLYKGEIVLTEKEFNKNYLDISSALNYCYMDAIIIKEG